METTQTIKLSKVIHREKEIICLHFNYDAELQQGVKSLTGYKWSHTHKAWYFENSPDLLKKLSDTFRNKAQLDYSALTEGGLASVTPIVQEAKQVNQGLSPLNADHKLKVDSFKLWMLSKRYSESTIGTYIEALVIFLRYFYLKTLEEITNDDLICFNNDYILKGKFSASYQNQVVNAVKLFFNTIENKKLQPELIHRPKRAKVLPNILSKEEIKLLLSAPSNIKHRSILSLIYSCGLRRSEAIHLKLTDIDVNRGLIIIRQAKGKKDRIVPLSEKIKILLSDYFASYKPKIWVFEGQDGKSAYDESSLAHVLKQALEKSKIKKPVTLHWLRHSYATHLLENGTDLRYIQEILGHSRSTTTEIYTHVSNKSIQKVISPFDTL